MPPPTPAGLRANADENNCITRETCKHLLQRFTVYIDREDEENFVDLFDPQRTNKIDYKDLLSTIDSDLFNWHYEPPEWVSTSEVSGAQERATLLHYAVQPSNAMRTIGALKTDAT